MDSAATVTRAGIIAVSLLLVWRIIQVNAVSFEESGSARLPGLPAATVASAEERHLQERSALQRILGDNPAEVAALLMLATEFEATGDKARATGAYRAALDLAPLDRRVLTQAALHFLRSDDSRGIEILARLVEQYPVSRPRAYPLMASDLAAGRHQAAWAGIVARNPAWLGSFVADSCARGIDPAVLVPLLLRRPVTQGAIAAEAACVIDRLRADDRWEEAYQLWLNLLPRERLANVGFVFNGSFEFAASGIGFDWMLQQRPEKETGHVAEVLQAPNAEGRRAVRIAYNGKRQSGIPVQQFLALPAGDYELTGLVRTEGIKSVRGIHWTLRCVEAAKPLAIVARSERFLGSGEWRPFSMDLNVGDSCRGQVLQLEPADEGAVAFVSGVAWFDDFRVRRR
ncbi:MAG: hypothetical protein IPP91_04940 [Betaproteobacteria bacterium]|nr:hypothetical protein [Betaproteobacteria bacterium]